MWEVRSVRFVDGINIKVDFREVYFSSNHKVQAIADKSFTIISAKTINELYSHLEKITIALTKNVITINKRTGEVFEGNRNVGYSKRYERTSSVTATGSIQ